MDPITAVVIVSLLCFGGGFGTAWAIKPDAAAKAIEAQAKVVEEIHVGQAKILEGQTAILDAAARPVVLDAELKSQLAEIPVQCRTGSGGDPRSAECAWATCLQYGQSSAQRPECRAVEAVMIERLKGAE